MGGSDSNVADVGVAFAFGWVGAAAASPPWPGAVEACGDVGGDSGFGVATSQVRSAEARALGVGGSDDRCRTDSSCDAWPSERSGWSVVNEHAAKSAVRSMGCPSVHVPASVLLRDPSGRASHSAPRWMSRYLPQTVLGRAMRGLARSAQRHPTERASRFRLLETSRHSMQDAPSAQPAGSGRRAWAAQGARPGQRRSRRLARFATWAGARTGLRGAVAARSRIPQARVRGLAMRVGLLGVRILSSVARAGLHVSRRGPGRGRGCAEP